MKNLLIITKKVDKNDQLLGFFIDWIVRFARKFHRVIIFCLEKGEFNLPENVEVISLGKDKKLPKLFWVFNFYKNIFLYRKQYDAVFVHMNPIWVVLGGWCWRLMQKKVFFWYTSGGVTAKLKLAEKFADTIFTASKESFRLLSKKVIVTGHGVDTELFKPKPSDPRSDLVSRFDLGGVKILSVGRISPIKNYETLIKAAKILKDQNIEFSVTIIGEPALEEDRRYENKLKLQVADYKLQSHFNFVGKVSHKNLPSYYQSHDVFVHLSRTGSLDKTLLEAMSCGMNILSSSDAARSFLPAELLFDENNAVELADKIKKISEKEIGGQLRQYVTENHNLDKLIDKMARVINEQ